jgi:hypothetical protein
MDQEISLSRVKLYLQNISLWNSAKNYSNFFFKLSTAVNPEEYFNTYQTYFQLFPTVKSALHAVSQSCIPYQPRVANEFPTFFLFIYFCYA